MKPAPFEYLRPATLAEAIEALADGGYAAKALAGGQSLIPAMNFRLAEPSLLVDLGAIDELKGIRSMDDGGLWIGAMTRQRDLERSPLIRDEIPLLAGAMPLIAHPQIRNRGTIGGSLAHADPAAELPAVVLALDAVFVVKGPDGERRIPAPEFYYGLFATALEPDELLVAIEVPAAPEGSFYAIDEVSRRHGDFALAGVAVSLRMAGGAVADVSIGLFSLSDGPELSTDGAACLLGEPLTDSAIRASAEATAAALDPPGDIHATPEYRRHLARVLTRRTLERIRSLADGAGSDGTSGGGGAGA